MLIGLVVFELIPILKEAWYEGFVQSIVQDFIKDPVWLDDERINAVVGYRGTQIMTGA
jgi:hypothetical protein